MSSSGEKYKIEVRKPDGEVVANISTRCTRRSYQKQRNRPEEITIGLDKDDIVQFARENKTNFKSIFFPNYHELHIFRNGSLVSAGQINYVDPRQVTVRGVGWLNLFKKRRTDIDEVYSSTDLGAIAWGLINASQNKTNGDLGITQGTVQTSSTGNREYELKRIYDALIQITESNGGPDIEITPDKVFNAYYPKQGRRLQRPALTYPGNIISINAPIDGDKMTNYLIGSGSGTGSDRLLRYAEDTTNQPTFGRREDIVQYPDVFDEDIMDALIDEQLRFDSGYYFPVEIVCSGDDPEIGSFGLGDEIPVKIYEDKELFSHVQGYWRIDSYRVDIDQNDQEIVTFRLNK